MRNLSNPPSRHVRPDMPRRILPVADRTTELIKADRPRCSDWSRRSVLIWGRPGAGTNARETRAPAP
jgi:hypothetical protein